MPMGSAFHVTYLLWPNFCIPPKSFFFVLRSVCLLLREDPYIMLEMRTTRFLVSGFRE